MGWEVSAAESAATASAASGAAATTGSSAFLGRLFSRSSALSRAREDPADALECEIPPTSHPALCLAPTAVPSSASAAFDEGRRSRAPRRALPKTRVVRERDGQRRAQTRANAPAYTEAREHTSPPSPSWPPSPTRPPPSRRHPRDALRASRCAAAGLRPASHRERRSSTGEKGPWCLYQEITRDPPKITTDPRWVPW